MNRKLFAKVRIIFFLFFLLFLSGCITDMAYLVSDHTVGVISRPITAPGLLLCRIKTFTKETLARLAIKLIRFPELETLPIPPIDPKRPMTDLIQMKMWLDKKYGKPVSGNLKLLIGGESFFSNFEKRVLEAKKTIDINTYIFDSDEVGKNVADLLKKKSSEKVKVRVLLDWFASKGAWKRSYEPGPYVNIISYLKNKSAIKVRRTNNLWFTSDHFKMILVDKQIAFFGGMNLGDEYRYKWRDMMVEVQGPLVRVFDRNFHRAWRRNKLFSDFLIFSDKYRRKKMSRFPGKVPCHVLITTPFRYDIYEAQLRAAKLAKHHIYVENPYIWNHRFLYALCAARKRGVDVRVTLASKIDIPSCQGLTKIAINTLLHHGVRVFMYPGMTHVKSAVYDGWACFGSANYDDLSLHKNFELNLSTDDPDFVKEIEEQLLLDGQKKSKEIQKIFPIEFIDAFTWNFKDFF